MDKQLRSREHLQSGGSHQEETDAFKPMNGRSGTLSWQQRPPRKVIVEADDQVFPVSDSSQIDPKRPSSLSAENHSGTAAAPSKTQILQSLGSKDPSWFRQTEDRAVSSAAYRKNREDTASDNSSWSGSIRLPGMTKEIQHASNPSSSPSLAGDRSSFFSRDGSFKSPASSVSGFSANTVRSAQPSLGSQKFDEPISETPSSLDSAGTTGAGRTLAMSPSQGRLSPERMERPPSPTKGLGGFVQSAMMKRSDSVNKRWSATVGPGLSRGNSIISNTGPRFPTGEATPLSGSRHSVSRESTPAITSRPPSRHGNDNIQTNENINATANFQLRNIAIAAQEEKAPTGSPQSPEPKDPVKSLPASPGKRWSPSKSSWLENAISRPESPKLVSPAPSQQPAWIASLNRARQERGSVDLSKSLGFKEVSTTSLLRSPPLGSTPNSSSLGEFSIAPISKSDQSIEGGSTHLDRDVKGSDSTGISRSTGNAREAAKPPGPVKPPKPSIENSSPQDPVRVEKELEDLSKEGLSSKNIKTKPETPPKKDLRSGLKSRIQPGENPVKEEPEFKNVFGKLKKTQTQNYVAPDELKDNILRGKSGLAVTGGPKKSEIRDEFKESILKKKQGMVAPSASTRIPSAVSKNAAAAVPEAIARRQGLGRTDSLVKDGPSRIAMSPKPAVSSSTLKAQIPVKTSTAQLHDELQSASSLESPQGSQASFASSLANALQRGPSPLTPESAPGQLREADKPPTGLGGREIPESDEASPQLTHATKSRARGPKRKPPSAKSSDISLGARSPSIKKSLAKPQDREPMTLGKISLSPTEHSDFSTSAVTFDGRFEREARPDSPRHPSAAVIYQSAGEPSQTASEQADSLDEAPLKQASVLKDKPLVSPKPSKPVESTVRRQERINQSEEANDHKISTPPKAPSGLGLKPLNKAPDVPRNMRAASPQLSKSPKSPPLLGKKPLQPAPESRPNERPVAPVGSKSPPPVNQKSQNVDTKHIPRSTAPKFPTPVASPTKSIPRSALLYADVFDDPPKAAVEISIDTQTMLDARSNYEGSPKIKTLRKQIFEVKDHGKQLPVPAHQEHILFEDCMYLCIHVFGTSTGTKTIEVYLWHGHGVPQSAIDDAQLFGKRVARENSGHLITVGQGKEPPNLFQALGGIVITRKGSSDRSEARPYMLCGRQHLGHVAFDELDFDASQLCRGFPFIVLSSNGITFLWKGHGAIADELGCARLIGMDVGANGEIIEVDDGKEPDTFWSSLPPGNRQPLSNGNSPWHLKRQCEKYVTRLFAVDAEAQRPKSSSGFISWGRRGSAPANDNLLTLARVSEVTPFTQLDLVDDNVFLLDAFFEVFV